MGGGDRFEFRASLSDLDGGLEVLHRSVERLRRVLGRREDDRALMLFETALGEMGSNVLTHGRPVDSPRPVEYTLRLHGSEVIASLTDAGPAAQEHLDDDMPDVDSDGGRGLALARALVDDLGYERDGGLNRWRLVKTL